MIYLAALEQNTGNLKRVVSETYTKRNGTI